MQTKLYDPDEECYESKADSESKKNNDPAPANLFEIQDLLEKKYGKNWYLTSNNKHKTKRKKKKKKKRGNWRS